MSPLDPIHPNRSFDVLELLLARVLEVSIELATHLSVDIFRDADSGRFGGTFEPSGNIHTIPEYVGSFDYYITNMDADAKLDAFILRHRCITFDHAALDLNGTPRRVHGTCELNQDTVARPLDDSAAMLGDLGF